MLWSPRKLPRPSVYTATMRWCLLVVLVALASPASADDSTVAAATAKEAETLAKAQKYEAAAAKFRAAHRLDPRPEYLCNVGVAYQRAKKWPKAQIYLGECLLRGQALDGKFIGLVRTALGTVEDNLRGQDFSPIEVIVPNGATITISGYDDDEVFVGSRVIWLPFGKHTVTATAEGYEPEAREIDVQTRNQRQVKFELKKVVVATESAKPPPIPASPPSKVPAIVATGVTVGLGVGALVAFLKARSTMKDAESMTITRPEYDAIVDDAHGFQHLSWGLAAGAGVGVIVSGYLWYRATRTPRLEITPTGGGVAMSLSGTW
jgi:hypothetical protein